MINCRWNCCNVVNPTFGFVSYSDIEWIRTNRLWGKRERVMTQVRASDRCSVASVLAPEDIKKGDYIATLSQTYELPSFYWDDCISAGEPSVIHLRFKSPDAGRPYRVKAVCLPFVYVKRSKADYSVLDVRSTQLVRLDNEYARTVIDQAKKQAAEGKKSKRKKKKKKKR